MYLASDFVLFYTPEITQFIEMQVSELPLPEEFVAKPSATLHDTFQHLIVGPAGKQDLASVQLVQSASYRPHINRKVVTHS